MKKFLILGVFAFGGLMASPKVGDMARFDYHFFGKDLGETHSDIKMELVEYDSTTKMYLGDYTVTQDGNTMNVKEWIAEDEIWTSEQIQDLIAHCSELDGTNETLQVKAGSFESFKLNGTVSDGDGNEIGQGPFWIANVPVVPAAQFKTDFYNGDKDHLELTEFHFGTEFSGRTFSPLIRNMITRLGRSIKSK